MKPGWLSPAIMVLAMAGCAPKGEPPSPPAAFPKAEGKYGALPKGEERPSRIDDFGLPLDIYLEAFDVPKEIIGPSPPIEEKLDAKKK